MKMYIWSQTCWDHYLIIVVCDVIAQPNMVYGVDTNIGNTFCHIHKKYEYDIVLASFSAIYRKAMCWGG